MITGRMRRSLLGWFHRIDRVARESFTIFHLKFEVMKVRSWMVHHVESLKMRWGTIYGKK